jgi:hypothetical protein
MTIFEFVGTIVNRPRPGRRDHRKFPGNRSGWERRHRGLDQGSQAEQNAQFFIHHPHRHAPVTNDLRIHSRSRRHCPPCDRSQSRHGEPCRHTAGHRACRRLGFAQK